MKLMKNVARFTALLCNMYSSCGAGMKIYDFLRYFVSFTLRDTGLMNSDLDPDPDSDPDSGFFLTMAFL
jgi:hypothetical protein